MTRVKTDPDLGGSPSVSSTSFAFPLYLDLTAYQLLPIAHTNSYSKVPSKLRESSVLSSAQVDRRSTSPDSRESSPSRSVSTFSLQSPILAGAPPPRKAKPNAAASKAGVNQYSPPPAPPIPKITFTESEYFVGEKALDFHTPMMLTPFKTWKERRQALRPIPRVTEPASRQSIRLFVVFSAISQAVLLYLELHIALYTYTL